jgi:hypothetical protein
MADKKDPLRERLEELGRMNTMYSERAWADWKPGDSPKLDHYMHVETPKADDESPRVPDKD